MDLDDLFNRDHHRSKRGNRNFEDKHGYHGDRRAENGNVSFDRDHRENSDQRRKHGDHKYRHHNNDLFNLSHLMPRLIANKKLLITAGVVFLAVIVLFAILVLPLFGQALDYINKNGLQGVIDRLLQGTGGSK